MVSRRWSWWRLAHASGGADGVEFARRAGGFGASAKSTGGGAVVLVRGEDGPPVAYVAVPEGDTAPRLAETLASLVSARKAGSEAPPLPTDGALLRLVARPSRLASKDTQAGREPNDVARFVASEMPTLSWLIMSFRAPTRGELQVSRRWWRHRLAGATQHYSNVQAPLLVSITAGSADGAAVAGFADQLASELPGFDLEVAPVAVYGRAQFVAAGLVVAAAGCSAMWLGSGQWLWSALGAAPGLVFAVAVAAGWWRSPRQRLADQLDRGQLPSVPKVPPFLIKAPQQAGLKRGSDGTMREVAESPGGYPLHRSTFLLAPEQVATVAWPHYGAGAGAAEVRLRETPPGLLDPSIGPAVGVDASGRAVHFDTGEMWRTVFISGEPGSGKSVLAQTLFAFDSLERVCPQRRPGWPGPRNSMIVWESKSAEGMREHLDWLRLTGDSFLVVDLLDANAPAIDMVPAGVPAATQAQELVNAMVYAFRDGSIQYASMGALKPVLTLALLLDDDDVRAAGLADRFESWSFLDLAGILLGVGTDGPAEGRAIVAAASSRCTKLKRAHDPAASELEEAIRGVSSLYGPSVTASEWKKQVAAPQNKIQFLNQVPSWWSPSRGRVSWRDVLENHWLVIVNVGPSRAGGTPPEDFRDTISSMMLYGLRAEIMRTCGGWQNAGRSVTIYCDELAILAGNARDDSSARVFEWLRKDGRAFGVRQVLATQDLPQLNLQLQRTMSGSGTTVWFRQESADVADQAARQLSTEASPWTADDLRSLPEHQAVVRATVGAQPQSSVAITTLFWPAADRHRFVADQHHECHDPQHHHRWTL